MIVDNNGKSDLNPSLDKRLKPSATAQRGPKGPKRPEGEKGKALRRPMAAP